jgi:hypothetical protein
LRAYRNPALSNSLRPDFNDVNARRERGKLVYALPRLLAVSAVIALVAAAWLALMPFNDREVRCGPPLFGAGPPGNYSIVPGNRSDKGEDRLTVAAALVAVSAIFAVGLLLARQSRAMPEAPSRREHAENASA